MQKLTRTLYFKLGRGLFILLWVLVAMQLTFLGAYWQVFLDESEQALNWRLASRIAPDLQRLLDRNATFSELMNFAAGVVKINPKADLFVIDPKGNVWGDFSFSNDYKVPRIDVADAIELAASDQRPRFPVYVQNPSNPGEEIIFSIAEVSLRGKPMYLLVTLNSWRNKAFFSVVGENSLGAVVVVLSMIALVLTSVIGVFMFFFLTKRFRLIATHVERFKNKDFSTRVPMTADDELGDLAATVNLMADTIVDSFQQLEQRDQLRRDLIANVSHDLRGPVAIIGGYTEDLLRTADRITPGDVRNFAGTLQRNVGSLQKLLHELFDLAKLETQEAKLELEPFPVDQLVSGLIGSYASKAEELELELVDACNDRLPLVLVDIAMIERVVTNLLENALRYTPAGGVVKISAEAEPAGVRIEISDTGLGIPEEDLPHIFDRFYRVASSKPRTGTSTGLGLAIVKKILEAHGAEITVRSAVGAGTTFSFLLPLSGSPSLD